MNGQTQDPSVFDYEGERWPGIEAGRATMQRHADIFFQPRTASMLFFLFLPAVISDGED